MIMPVFFLGLVIGFLFGCLYCRIKHNYFLKTKILPHLDATLKTLREAKERK